MKTTAKQKQRINLHIPLILIMSAPLILTHHSLPPKKTHRAITAAKMTGIQQHPQPFQQPVHPACS